MTQPKFFASQDEFRRWLQTNHDKETELLVGFHKVGSGVPSMTWSESVDQALCFGWIDGVRKRIDDRAYSIRFTPRKEKSIWSAVNIKKVGQLTEAGLMQPSGLAAFSRLDEKRSAVYAYESDSKELSREFEKVFRKNKKAWDFFELQPAWYRRQAIHRVMNAKQEKTRINRLERLILASENGERY